MCKVKRFRIFLLCCMSICIVFGSLQSFAYESVLFPYSEQRKAYMYAGVDNFRLSDFSYAGYKGGAEQVPHRVVTKSIKSIDGDNTQHIQNALNNAAGGCLYLNSGVYEINDEIVVPSNTVLRGSGAGSTFIKVTSSDAVRKSFIVGNRSLLTSPGVNYWSVNSGVKFDVVNDIDCNSKIISLSSTQGLSVNDWVIVRNEVDDNFRKLYNDGKTEEEGQLLWPSELSSIKYLRKIVKIDDHNIEINQPLYLPLSITHKLSVVKITYMAEEVGLEDFSIGFAIDANAQSVYHDTKSDGSVASSHACNAIFFGNVVNGWIKNVKTYSPLNNGFHIFSRGINLTNCKWITVDNCQIELPVNIGNGGNGYLYILSTVDSCLIKNCVASYGRHNFLFHFPSSGNVITNCKSNYSYISCDYHHSLAHSNLIDNSEIITSCYYPAFVCLYRGRGSTGAGYTGVNNVFWNIKISGEEHAMVGAETFKIESQQASANNGKGYIIGVGSVVGSAVTVGSEWREGIGVTGDLSPSSLYSAQLKLRLSGSVEETNVNPPSNLEIK